MKHIAFVLLFFIAASGHAQDQLFKKDNTKAEVKILEINPTEIKYKLFTYQDGPTITILKSEVALIIYQNGTHETFNVTAPTQQSQPLIVYTDDLRRLKAKERIQQDSIKLLRFAQLTTTKNVVFLNLLEPLNGSIGVSYLREFADGLFHAYVPVAVGVSEPIFNQNANTVFGSSYYNSGITNYKYERKVFEGGIGFHMHTSGKRAVTHFIGPYFGFMQFNGHYDSYTYDPNYYYYSQQPQQELTTRGFVMNRYTFMLNNGILIRIHQNFNMMLLAGFGYHTDDYLANNPKKYNYYNYNTSFLSNGFPINSVKLGFSLGYRF